MSNNIWEFKMTVQYMAGPGLWGKKKAKCVLRLSKFCKEKACEEATDELFRTGVYHTCFISRCKPICSMS